MMPEDRVAEKLAFMALGAVLAKPSLLKDINPDNVSHRGVAEALRSMVNDNGRATGLAYLFESLGVASVPGKRLEGVLEFIRWNGFARRVQDASRRLACGPCGNDAAYAQDARKLAEMLVSGPGGTDAPQAPKA